MIPDSFIEDLKYASNLEQTIGSYITLKRAGTNTVGLCPFHSEKSPSFTVFTDSQSYYCFGCGKGGDVITFIREIENLSYVEAIRFLAERAGMTVPEDSENDFAAKRRVRILEMNREAARIFHEALKLPESEAARTYLAGRGLSGKTIRRFGVGYAPNSWDFLREKLRAKGFTQEDMLAGALCNTSQSGRTYDMFRDRIIFPIIDLRGNVIAFGGRLMQGSGPKYLNSSDTPVFKKSRNLFALNFAKSTGSDTLILGEGYMDVIAMHQAGFENAVATLGTSLTADQARLCAQYAKKVVIAYDSDNAGQNAAKRAINLFGETGISVSVLQIEGAKDPDEYIQKFGRDRFENILGKGKSAIHFEIDKLRGQYNLADSEGKVQFLSAFCSLIAEVQNDLSRGVYIGEMATELDVGRDSITSTVNNIRKRKFNDMKRREANNLSAYVQDNQDSKETQRRRGGDITLLAAEEQLITMLMRHPDYYSLVKGQLEPQGFEDTVLGKLYGVITERLEQGLPIELIHLSAALEPQEMAKLTQLMVKGNELAFVREQALEYIKAIKRKKESPNLQALSEMSREEYEKYLERLRADKK